MEISEKKIKSTVESLDGANLYSKDFTKKVYKILEENFPPSQLKLDNGNNLINNVSPKFYNGFVKDFGAGGDEVTGNIFYFLFNHIKSPLNNDKAKISELFGVTENDIEELISNQFRYPQSGGIYAKNSIVNEVIPNWLFENIIKKHKKDDKYVTSREIDLSIANQNDIYNLEDINIEESKKILNNHNILVVDFIEYFKQKDKFYLKMNETNKEEYLETKKDIYFDFLVNANLTEDNRNIIYSDLFKTISEINKKKIATTETKTIKDISILKEFISKIEKKNNWFNEYFSHELENFKEFPIIFPYKHNDKVMAMAFRTQVPRKDGRRYEQFGSTIVEMELKTNPEYMFLIEGKMDKLSTQTMLKNLGLENVCSLVTFINANSKMPYEALKQIERTPNLKVINLLDNDLKGLEAQQKIFSLIFEQGNIEKVYDFKKYIDDKQIKINDMNDILRNKTMKFSLLNDFLNEKNKYQRKIINKGIEKDNDVIYLKNEGDLKTILDGKFKLKDNSKVYFKRQNHILNLTNFISNITEKYKLEKERIAEVEKEQKLEVENGKKIAEEDKLNINNEMLRIIDELNLVHSEVLFLEKGKTYPHNLVYENKEVFLIESPSNFLSQRNIYKLPTKMVKKYNNEIINEFVEQFIYDSCETAEELACNKKEETLKIKSNNFSETKSIENFSNWWLNKSTNGINSRVWSSEEVKEKALNACKYELKLIKDTYIGFEESLKEDFLEYFVKFDLFSQQKKDLNRFIGVRGSVNNFVSASIFGWTNLPTEVIEYQLKHKDIMFPERFMNPEKVSMADIDEEFSASTKEIIEEMYKEAGYLLPIVEKELTNGVIQYAKHPCGYTKIPEQFQQYVTKKTKYIPRTVKQLNTELKYDGIIQNIQRPFNYDKEIILKLGEVLFKKLPQITEGVQEVLLYQKNIKLPSFKKILINISNDSDKKIFKGILKLGENSYIDGLTGIKYNEAELKAEFKLKSMPFYDNTEDLFNLINKNDITLEVLEKHFEKEFKEYQEILKMDITREDLMLATSTFRPAFASKILLINEEKYEFIRNNKDKTAKIINVDTNEEIDPSLLDKQWLKKLDHIIEVEDKDGNKKNLSFYNFSEEDIENIKNILPLKSKEVFEKYLNKQYKPTYYLTIFDNQLKEFEIIQTILPNLKFTKKREEKANIKEVSVFEYIKENQKNREYFPSLNLSFGFILFQEQMYKFINDIAIEYSKKSVEPTEQVEFLKKWRKFADKIRKFSSKTADKLSSEEIKEAHQIFDMIKDLLSSIEKENKVFAEEALDVINKQFFTLERGAYLYNMGHALYVAFNATQESLFETKKEIFKQEQENNLEPIAIIEEKQVEYKKEEEEKNIDIDKYFEIKQTKSDNKTYYSLKNKYVELIKSDLNKFKFIESYRYFSDRNNLSLFNSDDLEIFINTLEQYIKELEEQPMFEEKTKASTNEKYYIFNKIVSQFITENKKDLYDNNIKFTYSKKGEYLVWNEEDKNKLLKIINQDYITPEAEEEIEKALIDNIHPLDLIEEDMPMLDDYDIPLLIEDDIPMILDDEINFTKEIHKNIIENETKEEIEYDIVSSTIEKAEVDIKGNLPEWLETGFKSMIEKNIKGFKYSEDENKYTIVLSDKLLSESDATFTNNFLARIKTKSEEVNFDLSNMSFDYKNVNVKSYKFKVSNPKIVNSLEEMIFNKQIGIEKDAVNCYYITTEGLDKEDEIINQNVIDKIKQDTFFKKEDLSNTNKIKENKVNTEIVLNYESPLTKKNIYFLNKNYEKELKKIENTLDKRIKDSLSIVNGTIRIDGYHNAIIIQELIEKEILSEDNIASITEEGHIKVNTEYNKTVYDLVSNEEIENYDYIDENWIIQDEEDFELIKEEIIKQEEKEATPDSNIVNIIYKENEILIQNPTDKLRSYLKGQSFNYLIFDEQKDMFRLKNQNKNNSEDFVKNLIKNIKERLNYIEKTPDRIEFHQDDYYFKLKGELPHELKNNLLSKAEEGVLYHDTKDFWSIQIKSSENDFSDEQIENNKNLVKEILSNPYFNIIPKIEEKLKKQQKINTKTP